MAYDLGIDVGTSYSAAAVRTDDGVVTVVGLGPIADSIPTVLFLDEDGTMVAGDAANRRALLDASGASREFKRRLGDATPSILRGTPFSAEALMAKMLRHVVDRVIDRQREEPRRITVSHPANWGPYKLEIFGQALQMAGLSHASLITEPAAAAIAYAVQTRVNPGDTVAVYDLGGGTFDAAVLRKTDSGFTVVGEPVGLEHVGGIDFDATIFEFVRETVDGNWDLDPDDPTHMTAMSHLRRRCVEAKELLSSETDAAIPVILPDVESTVRLTRPEFEARIRPIVMLTVTALEQAIARSRLDPTEIDAVLLVGGSSRIPLVGSILRGRFGDLVRVDTDPVHAVAKGAALAASGVLDITAPPAASAAPPAATPTPPPTATPPPVSGPATAELPLPPNRPTASAPLGPPPAPPVVERPTPPVAPAAAPPPSTVPTPAAVSTPTPAPVAAASTPAAPVWTPPVAPAPASEPSLPSGVTDRGSTDRSAPDRKRLLLVGIPVLLLVVGGIAFALSRGGGGTPTAADATESSGEGEPVDTTGTDATTDTTGTDTGTTPIVSRADAAAGDGMVEVEAGVYTLGLDQPESNTSETVTTSVELPAFHIDATEVTNAAYKAFVDQTGAIPPAGWRGGQYPADLAEHPVEGVSYDWAAAYCAATSKRLPTEAEWEAAARGPEARIWPWGDDAKAVSLPSEDTYPVGSIPENVSPFGAYDMTGNVWEWVADSYDDRVSAELRVLRGGQNGFLRETVTRLPVDPLKSSAIGTAGFRCAADGIDPAAVAGTFVDYAKPTGSNEPEVEPLPEGIIVFDDFTDSTSGWTEKAVDGEFRYGYHPNEYLHLETRAPLQDAVALAPWSSSPDEGYALFTTAFVEPSLTDEAGTFAYGLAFDLDEAGNGLVFVVDERSSVWQLYTRTVTPTGAFGAGVDYELIEQSSRSIPAQVSLEVIDLGNGEYQFRIDQSTVHTRTIPGYTGTGVGLALLSFDGSPKAHIHFDDFQVGEIG